MELGESRDTFTRGLDVRHPARTWLTLNEGGIVGGAPDLAVRRIKEAGFFVRTRLADDPRLIEDSRRDRITLSIGRSGTVVAATAS